MRGRKPKLDSVYNRPEKICIYPETEWVYVKRKWEIYVIMNVKNQYRCVKKYDVH